MTDKNKQYRTRDGREVRIYAVDGRGEWLIHGAAKNVDGWHPMSWRRDGTWCEVETPADLIEVKPRIQREVWVNVYPASVGAAASRELADEHAAVTRIACVKLVIDVEEGHGLD